MQRRTAHLYTHFTVNKPNFLAVAEKLTQISSKTILSAAHHLQKENVVAKLPKKEQDVCTCLNKLIRSQIMFLDPWHLKLEQETNF